MRLRLTLVASLTAAVLALGPATASAGTYDYLLAPMSMCGGQKQINTSLSTGEQEVIMRCMHKYARVRTGRARLAGHTLLQTSTDRKVGDMIRCNAFSHTACGRATLYHVHRVGYTNCRSWLAGENIAWGAGIASNGVPLGSVRAIMKAWVNSTGHRTNILDRRFRHIGLGLRKGTFGGRPNAQVWTTHFGNRAC